MKNNKGVTLTSLVIYIVLVTVVMAIVMRITTHFSNNMEDAADVSFETEFNKINLYLLDESKKSGNEISEITQDGMAVSFSQGNRYVYNYTDKIIYLNDGIKICENIEACLFEQKTAENGKDVLSLTITIDNTTKTAEYVVMRVEQQEGKVDIDDYLLGASLVTYYLKAGDYVDYVPDTGIYSVAAGEIGSGHDSIQTFETEVDDEKKGTNALKWRVLSIDEQTGEIELVSATTAQETTPLYLKGADGYNHGVDILNDLCEALYSKTVNGKKIAVGRSLNIEDINKKTTYNPKTNTKYGTECRFSTNNYYANYRKYPSLYALEDGFYIKGVKQEGGLSGSVGLDDGVTKDGLTTYSNVIGYTNDWDTTTNAMKKDVSVTYTHYKYIVENYLNLNLGMNTAPKGLIKTENPHWLASRCVYVGSANVYFYVFAIKGTSQLVCYDLFYANGSEFEPCWSVRPVVTLDATQLLDFSVGDGSEEKPWGMK